MSGTPQLKIYDSGGQYVAACKDVAAAAVLVSFYGSGSTIRHGHRRCVWTEGVDGAAGDSYDAVATAVFDRMSS